MAFVKKCLSGAGTTSRIPNKFWSSTQSSFGWVPSQLLPELTKVIRDLESITQTAWQHFMIETEPRQQQVRLDLALWLLEDWCLATRLEASLSSRQLFEPLEFPLNIRVSSNQNWSNFEELLRTSQREPIAQSQLMQVSTDATDSPIIVQRSTTAPNAQEPVTLLQFEVPTVSLTFVSDWWSLYK